MNTHSNTCPLHVIDEEIEKSKASARLPDDVKVLIDHVRRCISAFVQAQLDCINKI